MLPDGNVSGTPTTYSAVTVVNQSPQVGGTSTRILTPIGATVQPSAAKATLRGPWPILYQLPQLPKPVQDALSRQDDNMIQDSRTGLRSQLVQTLFEDMSSYTW